MPRSRASRAGKITRGSLALERQREREKTLKFMRCFVCKHRFVVNNWPDGKARLRKENKFMGKVICPNCLGRDPHRAKQFVRLSVVMEKLAQGEGKTAEIAAKLTKDWNEYKIPPEQLHLGKY